MKAEIEEAAGKLIGRHLTDIGRAANVVWLQFGSFPDYALHISCAWRLAEANHILVAGGDLFTPADPDMAPDDFHWDQRGATWFDVRARAWRDAVAEANVAVERVSGSDWGDLRLELTGGVVLEVFPDSGDAPHVETEFWRLFRPRTPDPHFVVGSEGIHRDTDA